MFDLINTHQDDFITFLTNEYQFTPISTQSVSSQTNQYQFRPQPAPLAFQPSIVKQRVDYNLPGFSLEHPQGVGIVGIVGTVWIFGIVLVDI